MAATRISQKPVVAVAVCGHPKAGHTEVSQKPGTTATPIMQKPAGATAYTEVSQK